MPPKKWHLPPCATFSLKSGIGDFNSSFVLKYWLGDRLLAMEDTLQCQVDEQSSICILLPFENGNTSRNPCPKAIAEIGCSSFD